MIRLAIARRIPILATLGLTLALGLASAPGRASAGVHPPRPFHARLTDAWDNVFNALFTPPATFTGLGQATHMGDVTQFGTLVLAPPDANGLAAGYGTVTTVAANGDSIDFCFEGILNAATGEGTGTFTFTGGTGRFAEVSGGGTFDALIDLSQAVGQTMTTTLDGTIRY